MLRIYMYIDSECHLDNATSTATATTSLCASIYCYLNNRMRLRPFFMPYLVIRLVVALHRSIDDLTFGKVAVVCRKRRLLRSAQTNKLDDVYLAEWVTRPLGKMSPTFRTQPKRIVQSRGQNWNKLTAHHLPFLGFTDFSKALAPLMLQWQFDSRNRQECYFALDDDRQRAEQKKRTREKCTFISILIFSLFSYFAFLSLSFYLTSSSSSNSSADNLSCKSITKRRWPVSPSHRTTTSVVAKWLGIK